MRPEAVAVARPPGAEVLLAVRGQWQSARTAESGRVLALLLGRGVLGLGAGTLAASGVRSLPWCSRRSRRRGCRNTKASVFAGLRFNRFARTRGHGGCSPGGAGSWAGAGHEFPTDDGEGVGAGRPVLGWGGRTRGACPRLIHQSKEESREVRGSPGACPRTRAPPGGCPVLRGCGEGGSWHGQVPSGPKLGGCFRRGEKGDRVLRIHFLARGRPCRA